MKNKGQSIIEYALITVIVLLGILIGGPYVLRSVNAHFKLWDEGIKDSYKENIQQANITNLPPISTNCSCNLKITGCGSPCGSTEHVVDYDCTPDGCNGLEGTHCVYDPQCCNEWSSISCGTLPIGTPVASQNPDNCTFGYVLQGHQCGADTSTRCMPDSSVPNMKCSPQCLGIITSKNGEKPIRCNPNENLDQNYGLSLIPNSAACDASKKCQVYCPPDLVPNETNTGCEVKNCQSPIIYFPRIFGWDSHGFESDNTSLLHPDEVCKYYGFINGGFAHRFDESNPLTDYAHPVNRSGQPYVSGFADSVSFSNGPYDDTSYIVYPIQQSGGDKLFSLNGKTAAWHKTSSNSWTEIICFPNDPQKIENSSRCPSSPGDPDKTYVIVGNSSAQCTSHPCQVYCNPGYVSTWGDSPSPTATCVKKN